MRDRRGFTLLELLIVLLVLAMILGLAVPSVMSSYRRNRLKNAAKQIRAELAEARVAAIESGMIYEFRFEPGTGRYEIAPRAASASASINASIAANNLAVAEASAASIQTVGPDGVVGNAPLGEDETSDERRIASAGDDVLESGGVAQRRLIDGVFFTGSQVAASTKEADPSSTAANVIEASALQMAQHSTSQGWAPPLVFYPNGRTSSAVVRLTSSDGERVYQVDITLRGLTGSSHIGRMERLREDASVDPFAAPSLETLPSATGVPSP